MIRLLVLTYVTAIIGAVAIPSIGRDRPSNLGWLFDLNRKVIEEPTRKSNVCGTEECKLIADVIKESMDDTVDPCDDFYEYACGNWANNNPVPDGEDSWSLWHMVQKKIETQVTEILEARPKSTDLLAVKLAKRWYTSCMDIDRIEEAGLTPLLTTLARFGGWPLILEPDEWHGHMYKWQRVDDQYARLTGHNALFSIEVDRGYLGESGEKYIIIMPPKIMNSHGLTDDDDDDSEEESDEDSEEGSQERGSEEKRKEPKVEDDQTKDEDVNESKSVRKTKTVKRKINKKALGYAKRRSNKGAMTRNNIIGRKMRKRTKRSWRERLFKNKIHKQKRVIKRKENHNAPRPEMHPRRRGKGLAHVSTNGKKETIKSKGHEEQTGIAKKMNYSGHYKRKYAEGEDDNNNEDNETNRENSVNDEIDIDNDLNNGEDGKDNDEDNDDNDEGAEADDEDNENDDDDDGDDDDHENDDEEKSPEVVREKYANFIRNVSLALAEARGVEISMEKLNKDIEDMIQFQINLTQIAWKHFDIENATLEEFQELQDSRASTSNGKINFARDITKMFADAGIQIEGDSPVAILFPTYFEKLITLLENTPDETIVNYVHWNFIGHMLPDTTEKMRNLSSWRDPGEPEKPRSAYCISGVRQHPIIGYEYVNEHFNEDMRKTAMDMIDDIQKEVEYQIKESDWMDDETKDFVFDKLINMKKLVGYPDWYRNTTFVKRIFKGLNVGPSYFENILSFLRYRSWKILQMWVVDEDEDDTMDSYVSPLMLNAFFMPYDNSLAITAADFQNPFFAFHRPQSINYGIIGFIMAHEVNHGFDDEGHLFDKNGNIMEWLSVMAEAYNKRAECFVDQFNGYSLSKSKDVKIKNYGNQTAGENIADTMGLQAVHRAYQRRERECGKPDTTLPGLRKYDNDQLFFLSFANLWCEARKDAEAALLSAKFDVHSPGRLRVIGSVSNSDDFAKAYNCPVGSPMNPEKKCNIWK